MRVYKKGMHFCKRGHVASYTYAYRESLDAHGKGRTRLRPHNLKQSLENNLWKRRGAKEKCLFAKDELESGSGREVADSGCAHERRSLQLAVSKLHIRGGARAPAFCGWTGASGTNGIVTARTPSPKKLDNTVRFPQQNFKSRRFRYLRRCPS